jgi:lipopolysaccharide biosynthesis glycosyltransferase
MTTDTLSRPVLHIVSNADERFYPGLALAVASAVAAASGACDYRFLILDGGLPSDELRNLSASIARIAGAKNMRATLEPLSIDLNRLAVLPERRGSRMTYAKLVLPEILASLDSIIYLDADVLCLTGIEAIHPPAGETDWLLAGARDFFGVIEKDCPWIAQVPVEERRLPYINCGMMWMNLKGLRDIDFTGRSIAARAAAGEARQGDQAVFNFLCRGKSHILPDSINHRTGIGSNRPLCAGNTNLNIHYIGSPKPWLGRPRTCEWLAHRVWHQARAALLPEMDVVETEAPPHDLATIRRKAFLYSLINPRRAAQYRSDLESLGDPGGILAATRERWKSLPIPANSVPTGITAPS